MKFNPATYPEKKLRSYSDTNILMQTKQGSGWVRAILGDLGSKYLYISIQYVCSAEVGGQGFIGAKYDMPFRSRKALMAKWAEIGGEAMGELTEYAKSVRSEAHHQSE